MAGGARTVRTGAGVCGKLGRMDCPPPPSADRIARSLAFMEAHLFGPLTLERLAQQAQLSAYHYARLFTAHMGRSPMAHLRGRRLLAAARRLLDQPQRSLLHLALDCGFESPEAFSRAFKRQFGVAPGRFRRGFSLTPLEGQFPMSLPESVQPQVALLPDRQTLAAFTVAGYARDFDESNKADIPQLWSRLLAQLPFEGQLPSWNSYGVVSCVSAENGSLRYLAGVAVHADAPLPPGFERLHIAAARYAVFRITLGGGGIHLQIKAAMAKIWGELLPASGLRVAAGPDFERYDGRQALDQAGAVIEFLVPVEA